MAQSELMPPAAPALYALDPAMPVLLRPDGAVQVGWDPRRAVLVRPPSGLAAAELAALLRSLRSPTPITDLQRQAARPRVGVRRRPGEPRHARDLHSRGVRHLPVRVRDGTGLVGRWSSRACFGQC